MAYDAFISYSHAADGRLAPSLQRGLERLGNPWYRRRALRIFRDQTNLSASPSLWTSIVQALDGARHFLLLASPEAAKSDWVRKEVAHWLSRNPPETILIVLTGGQIAWDARAGDFDRERTDALPDEMHGAFDDEPLHVDLRWARDDVQLNLNHPDFLNAIADLAAPIHGRDKDELVGEDIRQHKRAKLLAWTGSLLVASLAVAAGIAAYQAAAERDQKEQQRRLAQAGRLAAESRFALEQKRYDLASLLAAEAPRTLGSGDDSHALTALFRAVQTHSELLSHLHGDAFATALAYSPDGASLASAHTDGNVILWDLVSRSRKWVSTRPEMQKQVPAHGAERDALSFSQDGRTVALTSGAGVSVWDAENGQLLWGLDPPQLSAAEASPWPPAAPDLFEDVEISEDHRTVVTTQSSGFGKKTVGAWRLDTGEPIDAENAARLARLREPDDPQRRLESSAHLAMLQSVVDAKPLVREIIEGDRPYAVHMRKPASADAMQAIRQLREEAEASESTDLLQIAAVTVDGNIMLVDLAGRTSTETQPLSEQWSLWQGSGLGLSRDARTAVSGQGVFGTRIDFWDLTTGQSIARVEQNEVEDSLFKAVKSADARTLASVARDAKTIMLYHPEHGVSRIETGELLIERLALSPDGNTLAVGSVDGRVVLRRTMQGMKDFALPIPAGPDAVSAIAFSSHGRWLGIATGSLGSGSLRIWDMEGGNFTLQVSLRGLRGFAAEQVRGFGYSRNRIDELQFSPDSRRLGARLVDGTSLVWDLESGQPLAPAIRIGTEATVGKAGWGALMSDGAMAFSPDGSLLVVAMNRSKASTLEIVDVDSGRLLGRPLWKGEERIVDLVFADDGRKITALTSAGQLMTWETGPAWVQAACQIANRNLSCNEWVRFFGDERYRKTCPMFQAPIGC